MAYYEFEYHHEVPGEDVIPQDLHPYPFPWDIVHPHPVVSYASEGEAGAIGFVISAVMFSMWGAFIGGAAANSNWIPKYWNWSDPNTPVGILSGAVGGVLLPYGFFYSNNTVGSDNTVLIAGGGAYLGAATMSKRWLLQPTDLNDPGVVYGAFEGVQTAVWLIDATTSIYTFADEVQLDDGQRLAFAKFTYEVGLFIAYTYVSEYHNEYKFWKWNQTHEPGVLFAVLDGIESGTRLPVGFAEIAREISHRSFANKHPQGSVTLHLAPESFENLDLWSMFGAGFMAFLYASQVNKNFDCTKWDFNFNTIEAIANGIVYGKDLPEMAQDVRNKYFKRKISQERSSDSRQTPEFVLSRRFDRDE